MVFAYAGLLALLTGHQHVSLDRLANQINLAGSELDGIAAAILGGRHDTGGSSTVLGTFLGVALITLVMNVLILVGIPSMEQLAIAGAFIVLVSLVFFIRLGRGALS